MFNSLYGPPYLRHRNPPNPLLVNTHTDPRLLDTVSRLASSPHLFFHKSKNKYKVKSLEFRRNLLKTSQMSSSLIIFSRVKEFVFKNTRNNTQKKYQKAL